jgi:hypothetical protein
MVVEDRPPAGRRSRRANDEEAVLACLLTHVPDQPGDEHDERERDAEREDGDERGRRDRDHDPVLQRAAADAQDGFDDDREHRWFQAEENGRDERDVGVAHVQDAQRQDGEESRQHEQRAGDETSPPPMEHPPAVRGELLRLRSGQQHHVAHRVEESVLAEPTALVHEDALHDRDLAGRASEAERRDTGPHAEALPEGDPVGRFGVHAVAHARRDRKCS